MRRVLPLLALLLCALPAHAVTTITRVGSCQAAGVTCTPPAHQAGDLFIAYAYRNNSTAASLPIGWTSISSNSGTNESARVACKIAASSSETAAGFTNAVGLIVIVYRGVQQSIACNTLTVGTTGITDNVSSATLSYGGITLANTNATSWVVGCGGSNTATNVNQAPTGMTTVTSVTGNGVSCSDTNAPTSTWTTQTVGVNASAPWNTFLLEIRTCQLAVCIQSLTIGSASGSTNTVASPAANHGAGHKLVAFVNNATGGTNVMGVANTAADTWALCSGSRESTVGHVEFWETTSVPNGNAADIVTATFTGNDTSKNIGVYEYTGLATSACETAAIGSGTSTTTFTTASFSPAAAGNYNIAGTFSSTGITATAGTGYTLNCCTSNGLEDRFPAPAGSQTASVTMSPSSNTGISVASFKAALIGGAGMQVGSFLIGP